MRVHMVQETRKSRKTTNHGQVTNTLPHILSDTSNATDRIFAVILKLHEISERKLQGR